MSELSLRAAEETLVAVEFNESHDVENRPLFHSGKKPNAALAVTASPEEEVYGYGEVDLHGLVSSKQRGSGRRVPTEVISETKLNIPFDFLYPTSLKSKLEQFGKRLISWDMDVRCRVLLGSPCSFSDYVCAIKFESNDDLMEAIYA